MEPLTTAIDKFKSLAKSSEDFVKGVIHHRASNSSRSNPIEILKRLQREAFSDLMKLRDRQDKIERIVSLYKPIQGSPFRETSTHMKGEVDVVGALLFVRNIGQQTLDALSRAGIRTGVNSKFIFETIIRQKDSLVAELVAGQNSGSHHGDIFGSPLALTKVMYLANINDWLSLIAIPVGAQCKDVAINSNRLQGQGLTDFSSFGPPLFTQYHDCGAGLVVKGSNYTAHLAEFVSCLGMEPVGIRHCLSTLVQVIHRPSEGTKVTLLGLHQMSKSPAQQVRVGPLIIPLTSLKFRNATDSVSEGSISLMLESELDESMKIGGWVELQNSSSRYLRWGVSLSDTPENELGWGLSTSGMIQRPSSWVNFQLEAFLKFSFGKRFSFQPGLIYAIHDKTRIPALMFRSSWSL
ncbi:GDSL esterase/lipase [Tasmannia lanceolata]|uniref:GDSL esterase/lipase n=1 Tax=Tasmannia lanceolata TaxID=3420 RepID=UPI004062D02D